MVQVLSSLLGLLSVFSGILVITSKNPIVSVVFLISVFINVSGYLMLSGLAYVGLVYLIVYVGAIAILFLFVIMMLNLRLVELVETGKNYTKNLPIALVITLLYVLVINRGSLALDFGILPNLLSLFDSISTSLLNTEGFFDINTSRHIFNRRHWDSSFQKYNQVESVGRALYTHTRLWLILAGLLFLMGMVGPIILCFS